MFWPSASSPRCVEGPSASTSLAGDRVADLHQRPLVDAGVLVGARVLGQVVDVDARLAGRDLVLVDADHDARGVHRVHHPAAARVDRHARVCRDGALDAGADERRGERSVGTACRCMFEPINARFASSCSRKGISAAATDTIWRGDTSMYAMRSDGISVNSFWIAAGHQLVGEPALRVELGVRLGDHELALLDRRQVVDVVGDLAVAHAPVRASRGSRTCSCARRPPAS